ncbi:MAG: hypothetical protein KatS3mg118_0036 [Paracoccaceae bacterium]|nr:MAG: hypothetical protein KatS3mg118_0036 [Paracoccaceae bacterium]
MKRGGGAAGTAPASATGAGAGGPAGGRDRWPGLRASHAGRATEQVAFSGKPAPGCREGPPGCSSGRHRFARMPEPAPGGPLSTDGLLPGTPRGSGRRDSRGSGFLHACGRTGAAVAALAGRRAALPSATRSAGDGDPRRQGPAVPRHREPALRSMRRCSEGLAEADIAPSAGGCRDPALVEATDGPNEAEVIHRRAPGQGGAAVDRASREPVSRFGKPRRRSRMRARSCSNILTYPSSQPRGRMRSGWRRARRRCSWA